MSSAADEEEFIQFVPFGNASEGFRSIAIWRGPLSAVPGNQNADILPFVFPEIVFLLRIMFQEKQVKSGWNQLLGNKNRQVAKGYIHEARRGILPSHAKKRKKLRDSELRRDTLMKLE